MKAIANAGVDAFEPASVRQLQWHVCLPDGGDADLTFRGEVAHRRQLLAGVRAVVKAESYAGPTHSYDRVEAMG
jgi:hypothetical protein